VRPSPGFLPGFRGPVLVAVALALGGTAGCPRGLAPRAPRAPEPWRLVYHETFDRPFAEPEGWVEDRYGEDSPYHVDAFDEDGAFFADQLGPAFREGLGAFRSYRKSYTHGADGWLTVELYGRDADRDGRPESGGRFEARGGKARLVSARHTDGALIRSTRPLPARYRIEVTVSDIAFGGLDAGGRGPNGYGGDERAGPWRWDRARGQPMPATSDNGLYFLCITDYPRPAPHNNVFIHHHRKAVIDTDNNHYDDGPWSMVWNPKTRRAEPDGHHPFNLFVLSGESWVSEWTGNAFVSWSPAGWREGFVMADKYLDGEAYVVAIERDGEAFTLSASGRFHHGGRTTYRATRRLRDRPVVWHYNQTPEEYRPATFDRPRPYLGKEGRAWPAGSGYPEHFILGDPHINYYEGTAAFDDLKLWLPGRE
jgi:hypothetical protein